MKQKITYFLIAISLIGCSVEENTTTTLSDENFVITTREETILQVPEPKFDHDQKGLYQGTITTLHQDFHEKITINLGNNGSYNAFIKSSIGRTHFFTTKETIDSEIPVSYTHLTLPTILLV